jgi:TolA-binding protein
MSTGLPLLTILAATALWPFGRDDARDKDAEPTIADLAGREVVIDTEGRIPDSQSKAIESYQVFVDLAGDDPLLHAEAMRRLADLQLENSEVEELQANVRAVIDRSAGTVDLYESLLRTYPRYEKNDLVLYQLARAYELEGEPERALDALDRLVTEYPATPHLAEAEFRRGEILFIQRRYQEAEEAYGAVLASGDDQFLEQSLYKQGWALFKQLRHEESLAPFFRLLDIEFSADAGVASADPESIYTGMGRADQELIDDTFRVLSINFSYIDGPRAITDYFRTHGLRSYAYVVYSNLGDLYLEKERYQDAANAFGAFSELDAYHEKAPLLQAQVIDAYEGGGFAGLVLDAKRSFVELYGPSSPYWERFTYEEEPEVVAHLKANLMDLAAYYHADAQETGNSESYRLAGRWYRNYLAAFPDDPGSAHTNFLLAEVLFESGDYRAAVVEYERTAYDFPLHEESAEAAYAALLAYREIEETLDHTAREPWQRQQIDSALRFARAYPLHAEANAAMTDAAEQLFALNELTRARDVSRELLAREPAADATMRRTAWTIVAHSEFDLGNFAGAEQAYLAVLEFYAADAPERPELVERVASSIYKQGELARFELDYAASVEHFLRVWTTTPSASIVATARYDAAADLMVLEDWPRAINVLEAFRRDYPEHEYAADVTAKLAVAYLSSGNGVLAATEFERIADGDESEEVRKQALWQAATLYREAGQLGSATVALAHYVDRYPRPAPVAVEALQQLADIAGQRDDYPGRMRWLEAIVTADARAEDERNDRTRYLASHAALELAMPARDAFAAVRLVAPLPESLARKRERMEAALAAFGRAADYGVSDVTTAATYEIAELYHGLSRDLFDSERPADLSALELDQYEILLEEQAFPFEEQAIELHEVNAARTADGTYDESVRKSLDALAELLPVRYAKSEQGEPYVAALQ